MKLFDPSLVDVGKTEYRVRGDSEYFHHASTNRPGAQLVRDTLDGWFALFPAEHQHDLRQRFRSDNTNFQGAFFELVMYAMFQAMGAQVEVHPQNPVGTSRPDFHVVFPQGPSFYVDATVASDLSPVERKRTEVKERLLARIETDLHTERYWWGVEVDAMGTRMVEKEVMAALKRHAQGLDYALVVAAEHSPFRSEPFVFKWAQDGWIIRFEPFPRPPAEDGETQTGTHIAMEMEERWGDGSDTIAGAVERKLKQHRGLDNLVVAINHVDFFAMDKRPFTRALYGEETLTSSFTREEGARWFMAPSPSIWQTYGEPRNQRLVAVLGTWNLSPFAVNSKQLILFPQGPVWPSPALEGVPLPRYSDVSKSFENPQPMGKVLGLPEDWPDKDLADHMRGHGFEQN